MSRARTLSAWSPRALITMTEGMRRPSRLDSTCQPSTNGSPMSSKTTSNDFAFIAWTPTDPPAACSTSKPPDWSAPTRTVRNARSSSTTRMRPATPLPRGRDVEGRAIEDLGIRPGEHSLQAQARSRQPVLDLFGPDDGDVGVLRDGPSVGQPVIDLEARPISIEGPHTDPIAATCPQPVWIGELEGEDPRIGEVIGGSAQALDQVEDVCGRDDEVEAPAALEVFDARLDQLSSGEPFPKPVEHAGVAVDTDQLDTRSAQRHGEPSAADAEIENRRRGALSQLEPGPQVGRVGQLRVELGESGVGIRRVVVHTGHPRFRGKPRSYGARPRARASGRSRRGPPELRVHLR